MNVSITNVTEPKLPDNMNERFCVERTSTCSFTFDRDVGWTVIAMELVNIPVENQALRKYEELDTCTYEELYILQLHLCLLSCTAYFTILLECLDCYIAS